MKVNLNFKKHNRNWKKFLTASIFHFSLNPTTVTVAVGCLEQLGIIMMKLITCMFRQVIIVVAVEIKDKLIFSLCLIQRFFSDPPTA